MESVTKVSKTNTVLSIIKRHRLAAEADYVDRSLLWILIRYNRYGWFLFNDTDSHAYICPLLEGCFIPSLSLPISDSACLCLSISLSLYLSPSLCVFLSLCSNLFPSLYQ